MGTTSGWTGLTVPAIRKRVERRTIPFLKFRGRIMFPRAEVERFLDECPGVTVDEALANVQGE